ncbi:hypothetical protein ACQPUL_01075 [Clostridium butyricum]|uniref:hypothetical protein n=1 Tax=Clostridium butyricum TaxID=1492 RepID=UPI00374EE37E
MQEIYTVYLCCRCRKEIILITEEVENTLKYDKYLSCSHCGSKNIIEENKTNDLRKCMDHNSYKKVKGKIRQVHSV